MPSSGPDWTVDVTQATTLDALCCVEETECLDFADTFIGLFVACFLPVGPGREGFQETPDVGAGIHTWTTWPGGEVGSGQQAGTSEAGPKWTFVTIQRMEKVPVITDCCPFSSSTPPHPTLTYTHEYFWVQSPTWPAVPKLRGRCGASTAAPPGTLHLLWGWSLQGGIGGWADRSECKVHSLLKFFFFLSSYFQGPFLAPCGSVSIISRG